MSSFWMFFFRFCVLFSINKAACDFAVYDFSDTDGYADLNSWIPVSLADLQTTYNTEFIDFMTANSQILPLLNAWTSGNCAFADRSTLTRITISGCTHISTTLGCTATYTVPNDVGLQCSTAAAITVTSGTLFIAGTSAVLTSNHPGFYRKCSTCSYGIYDYADTDSYAWNNGYTLMSIADLTTTYQSDFVAFYQANGNTLPILGGWTGSGNCAFASSGSTLRLVIAGCEFILVSSGCAADYIYPNSVGIQCYSGTVYSTVTITTSTIWTTQATTTLSTAKHPGFFRSISCTAPTAQPTNNPVNSPTPFPSPIPTRNPTKSPSDNPTKLPSDNPSRNPTPSPTNNPSRNPTPSPTDGPSDYPTPSPTNNPSGDPTKSPSRVPTPSPTNNPSTDPTKSPTDNPSTSPTDNPSHDPTSSPTDNPSLIPTKSPTNNPSTSPTNNPSVSPTNNPSASPTTNNPTTYSPTNNPTTWRPTVVGETRSPTREPTTSPSDITTAPTIRPTPPPTGEGNADQTTEEPIPQESTQDDQGGNGGNLTADNSSFFGDNLIMIIVAGMGLCIVCLIMLLCLYLARNRRLKKQVSGKHAMNVGSMSFNDAMGTSTNAEQPGAEGGGTGNTGMQRIMSESNINYENGFSDGEAQTTGTKLPVLPNDGMNGMNGMGMGMAGMNGMGAFGMMNQMNNMHENMMNNMGMGMSNNMGMGIGMVEMLPVQPAINVIQPTVGVTNGQNQNQNDNVNIMDNDDEDEDDLLYGNKSSTFYGNNDNNGVQETVGGPQFDPNTPHQGELKLCAQCNQNKSAQSGKLDNTNGSWYCNGCWEEF